MTAEIGILNKTSVVLASDSAVTIGNMNKVFNTANKLYPLSKYQPVGVMIFNNASWMGIPIEIILKSYSNYLEKSSFDTLEEYRQDLVKFIKEHYNDFVSKEQIKSFIEFRLYDLLERLIEHCNELFTDKHGEMLDDLSAKEKSQLFENTFFEIIDEAASFKTEILPDFKDYRLEDFKNEFRVYINKILPLFYSNYKIERKAKYTTRIIKQLYHELICNFSNEEDYTGIAIAGYGEKEIFPSICDVKVGEFFSNRLRYQFSAVGKVNQDVSAIVHPYAQRDMVDTFFQGINPGLLNEFARTLPIEFENIADKISSKYNNKSEIKPHFQLAYKHIMKKLNNFAIKNYVHPIITSIGFLRKEDLVEIAEALINITSINRKTTKELQTVGGPIDIAIITKHEGFIWIKRKDLVNKDLNSIYYNRELKEL